MEVAAHGENPENPAAQEPQLVQGRPADSQQQRIYSKPPKTKIGPGQTFFIMSVFSMALLLPAGWILHHLPEYRRRTPAPPS
ncbi:hypothetical protein AMELA_G00281790 [Ameiurus melas]|uniref:Uncharacterized protein n=1 Tax=Ameiurus melas TaxID=219545 RepID=A0A7J5ZKF2_AMEME|nr:hypothetical protein AMELA_G00281790 [Ameiurus melas]